MQKQLSKEIRHTQKTFSSVLLSVFTKDYVLLLVVTLVAVCARVVMFEGSSLLLWPDSLHYYKTAKLGWISGDFSVHPAFHTPFYPFFIALHFWAFGETPLVGKVLFFSQQFLGLVSVVLVFMAATKWLGRVVGFIAAMGFAVYGLLLYYETLVLTEAVFVFWVCVLLFVLSRDMPQGWGNRTMRLITIGAACALLTLTRPVALHYIWLVAAFVMLKEVGQGFRNRLLSVTIVITTYFLCLFPWCLNNYCYHGFFGVSKGRGINLFMRSFEKDGLQPTTHDKLSLQVYHTFHQFLVHDQERNAYFKTYFWLSNKLQSQAKADDFMWAMAKSSIISNPVPYISQTAMEFLRMFFAPRDSVHFCKSADDVPALCIPQTQGQSRPAISNSIRKNHRLARKGVMFLIEGLKMPFALLSCLAFLGFIVSYFVQHEKRKEVLFLAITIIYFTALPCILNMPEDRYRLPVDSIMYMFAACGLVIICRFLSERLPSWNREPK